MTDWLDKLDPEDREQWDAFVDHFRRDALEKMVGSAAMVSLVPRGDGDVKFYVELGAMIMLDKPILAIVPVGRKPPEKLARVADVIVEADVDTEEGRRKIAEAIEALDIRRGA